MYEIQKITDDGLQQQGFTLFDGSVLTVTMRFVPLQLGWFIDELTWNDFTLNGLRVVNHPNMLHQFKNLLSFGLGCFSRNDREPTLQEDFSSRSSILYVLDTDEVKQFSEIISGEVSI